MMLNSYLIKRKYVVLEGSETPKFIVANGRIFTKENFKENLVEVIPDLELSELLEWIKTNYASGSGELLHLVPSADSYFESEEAIDVNSVAVAGNAYYSTEIVGLVYDATKLLRVLKYNLNSKTDKLFLEKIENPITLPAIKVGESIGKYNNINYFEPEYLGSNDGLIVATKENCMVSFKDSEMDIFLKELKLLEEVK